jgi:hypothetical protein
MKTIEVKVRGVGVVEPKVRRGYLEFLCVYSGSLFTDFSQLFSRGAVSELFLFARSLLRFALRISKKAPIRRFFTLQTPKAARKSWFLRYKLVQKPTSATGC